MKRRYVYLDSADGMMTTHDVEVDATKTLCGKSIDSMEKISRGCVCICMKCLEASTKKYVDELSRNKLRSTMEKSLKEMMKRHLKEVEELQKKCPHKRLSDWINVTMQDYELPEEEQPSWVTRRRGTRPIKQIKKCVACESTVITRNLIEEWKEVDERHQV